MTPTEIRDLVGIWQENPEVFFEDVLNAGLWSKEEEIIHSVRDHQKTTVRSNNSSGKTYTMARVALWFLMAYSPAIVIDTAPTHRQVENQFWRELRKAYKGATIPLGGKLLKTQLNFDEDWFAIGFSSKGNEDVKEKFQGWHGYNMLIIVDEASGIEPAVMEAILGALASGNTVKLVLIGNPTKNTGEFAESFKDPSFNKIHISAYDVPNVKEGRIVIPGLATKEWVEDMIRKYGEDSDVVRVKVKGEFPKNEDGTVVSVDLLERALGADREIYGDEEVIGLDVARKGKNASVFFYRKGNYGKVLEKVQGNDLMQVAGKAKLWLKEYPNARLKVDIIGLGVGVFDRLKEQPDVADRVGGVNTAVPPTDRDKYINLRAEAWFDTREWLRDAVIEPNEDLYELCKPRYKITSQGKLQVESKDDMEKRGIESPDTGDAVVLTMCRDTEGGYLAPIAAG